MPKKSFAAIAVFSCFLAAQAGAQTNGLGPAELPPAGFDSREYVDSRGCVFLRSTFGGEVTWVPRFGADRQPICDATPSMAAAAPPPARVQPVPQPTGSTMRATDPIMGKEPPVRARARQAVSPRAARPRMQHRQADATGRHPDCPTQAPFGQMVRTSDGRLLVLCVASVDQFPDGLFRAEGQPRPHRVALPADTVMPPAQPHPQPAGLASGLRVQVGSFRVPANATRLRARLAQHGFNAHIHPAGGLDVVTIGPFGNSAQANNGLHRVRAMGFHDAFLRR